MSTSFSSEAMYDDKNKTGSYEENTSNGRTNNGKTVEKRLWLRAKEEEKTKSSKSAIDDKRMVQERL